ncbi:hypothetical protein GGR50DRAFT_668597 [Xylaria sp. CBS 124048]|nr:hypothetical protein GGR50DRAFT_668597 [Xylaria sp. CBS 124048]
MAFGMDYLKQKMERIKEGIVSALDYVAKPIRGWNDRLASPISPFAGWAMVLMTCIIAGAVFAGVFAMAHLAAKHLAIVPEANETVGLTEVPFIAPVYGQTTTLDTTPFLLDYRTVTDLAGGPYTTNSATPTGELESITILHTVVVTVTNVVTDTALKMSTTTVFKTTDRASTITGGNPATTSLASGDVMTGVMYCSFTGRPGIYTLCPMVHTNSPGMLADTPPMVSSAQRRFTNPFTPLRLAIAFLWNSVPIHARQYLPRPVDEYDLLMSGLRPFVPPRPGVTVAQLRDLTRHETAEQYRTISEARRQLFLAADRARAYRALHVPYDYYHELLAEARLRRLVEAGRFNRGMTWARRHYAELEEIRRAQPGRQRDAAANRTSH